MRQRILGAHHPDTLNSSKNLAVTLEERHVHADRRHGPDDPCKQEQACVAKAADGPKTRENVCAAEAADGPEEREGECATEGGLKARQALRESAFPYVEGLIPCPGPVGYPGQ